MSLHQFKISKSFTNRNEESLGRYLAEINKIDMISPEDEVQLASRIKQGDESARDKLTKANLRFVISVAKQFQNQGLSLPDLINEGNIGLIIAAQRYDETKGFRFVSYAIWWIRQSILKAILEQGKQVKLPLIRSRNLKRIQRASAKLEQTLEREPSAEEVAATLDMNYEEVHNALSTNLRCVSMDAPIAGAEETTLIDVLQNHNAAGADHQLMHDQSLHLELHRSLGSLSNVQRTIICDFFGIGIDRPLTLEAIAEKLHLSRERIRQIKDKAITILQEKQQSNRLRSFIAA